MTNLTSCPLVHPSAVITAHMPVDFVRKAAMKAGILSALPPRPPLQARSRTPSCVGDGGGGVYLLQAVCLVQPHGLLQTVRLLSTSDPPFHDQVMGVVTFTILNGWKLGVLEAVIFVMVSSSTSLESRLVTPLQP